jgi:broad specificity phosphatase PhoE
VTTTFFLVRHAAHDNVGGFLAGRMEGVRMGEAGRAQAGRLAERMRRESFERILASPRERTQETAAAIATASGIGPVETAPELDEVDFGSWSGRTFDDLNRDPLWRQWNTVRSLAHTAGGETMLDVQARIAGLMTRIAGDRAEGGRVVLVTHADVIKSAVMLVLGMPVDAWARLEVAPASITTLVIGDWGATVHGLNEVVS